MFFYDSICISNFRGQKKWFQKIITKYFGLETSRVSIAEIKNAYRMAAKKNHPDVNALDTLAEEKIKDINEAYKTLSNPTSKRKYDRIWNLNNTKKNIRTFSFKEGSIIKILLGNIKKDINKKIVNKETTVKGENIETRIEVSIDEAFMGKTKTIELKNMLGKNQKISINIPKGIQNGGKIRLPGLGKQGENNGESGDLIIKVNIIEGEGIKLEGNDIVKELLITPWEAALGKSIDCNILKESIKVKIPKYTQNGKKITIPNHGYIGANLTRGNLIVEIKIVIPSNLNKEEEELFKKLSKVSRFDPRKY